MENDLILICPQISVSHMRGEMPFDLEVLKTQALLAHDLND